MAPLPVGSPVGMELLIIRHGLPIRIEGANGPADPPLADRGHEQAAALADWLRGDPIHAIYSSPMQRARQTAAPLADVLGHQLLIDDDIAEWDRNSSEYIPIEELKAAKDERYYSMLNGTDWQGDVPPEVFKARVVAAFERIVAAHKGQRVAVVCHGGVINAYTSQVLGIDAGVGFFHPDYTSINRVEASSAGHRSIRSLNETGHLRPAGLLR
jgi:2,3-bisphosphoglycerate-dependent phosphoglycerate mutase